MKDEKLINQGKNLIKLIKSLLREEKVELINPDFEAIYKLSTFHSVQNMLFYATDAYKNQVSVEVLKKLGKDNKMQLAKTATQEIEKDKIIEELNKNQIKYMLMKGSVIKYLYPSIDMRSMADIDIYIDKDRAKDIKKMMGNLGYDSESYQHGNHDTYMKVPFMNIEMHRDLMNECYEMSRYYKNFFGRLQKGKNEYEYVFSIDDYYIYMISHAAKHFSNGGMGIRNVVDEYVYLLNYDKELNYYYIQEELEKLGLVKFEENLRKLSNYWFLDKVEAKDLETLELMEEFIIESGTYGTVNHNVLKNLMGKEALDKINTTRFKYMLRRAFPPYSVMKQRNPSLVKLPFLLPFFYFTRLCKFIFKRNKNIDSEIKAANNANQEDIEKMKKIHDDIGA